jgi:hypothetical protein
MSTPMRLQLLRRLLAVPAGLVLMLPLTPMFLQQAAAEDDSASFYKWDDYEARDPKLLDAQVLALTTHSLEPLEKLRAESTSEEGITISLTFAVVRSLPEDSHVSFDKDGASAFGIWMQAAAHNLVGKGQTSKERIKTAMVQARGFIYWLRVDDNLNPLSAAVTITQALVKKVHDAFCPLYPFC